MHKAVTMALQMEVAPNAPPTTQTAEEASRTEPQHPAAVIRTATVGTAEATDPPQAHVHPSLREAMGITSRQEHL